MFKGALPFIEAACGGPPSTTIVVPLPLASRGRQDFEKMASRHYAYLPTPILGVGGERSETEGGIFLAPHCLSGGRGPCSGEGGLPKARFRRKL